MFRNFADHRAEEPDFFAGLVDESKDGRANVGTDQCDAVVHMGTNVRIERAVVERGGVRYRETNFGQRLDGVKLEVLLVMNTKTERPIEVAEFGASLGGSDRFEYSEQVMGATHLGVPRGVRLRVVLDEQADRKPVHREVAVCSDIDDPTRRQPAPRSNRVEPEVKFHA